MSDPGLLYRDGVADSGMNLKTGSHAGAAARKMDVCRKVVIDSKTWS
jgi:hypothetical protein